MGEEGEGEAGGERIEEAEGSKKDSIEKSVTENPVREGRRARRRGDFLLELEVLEVINVREEGELSLVERGKALTRGEREGEEVASS